MLFHLELGLMMLPHSQLTIPGARSLAADTLYGRGGGQTTTSGMRLRVDGGLG